MKTIKISDETYNRILPHRGSYNEIWKSWDEVLNYLIDFWEES
jgi:predicted CopG family antitoxin